MTSGLALTIRKMRTSQGVSIRELERRSGINRGRLSIIERGVEPTVDELRAIFAALDEQGPKEVA